MADKVLVNVAGQLTSKEAVVTSAGVGDSGKVVGLDGTGKLDMSVMPSGLGADTVSLPASVELVAGDFVNIWDDAGTLKVRKATNTAVSTKADGFVLTGVAQDSTAVVYLEGANTELSALVVGSKYFLGVDGAVTTTAPTASSSVVQYLGVVKSATSLRFEQNDYFVNA
jgi:hypothetical protein